QEIPEGVLVTVPDPLPARTTATANHWAIVNVSAFEVPPPCEEFSTVTWAAPATARSLAKIVAFNSVSLANVVGRLAPFHWTTELASKLPPLTISGTPAAPAAAAVGVSALSEGTGCGAAGAS